MSRAYTETRPRCPGGWRQGQHHGVRSSGHGGHKGHQCLDVVVAEQLGVGRHDRVGAGVGAVAVALEGGAQVLGLLAGDAGDLVVAAAHVAVAAEAVFLD